MRDWDVLDSHLAEASPQAAVAYLVASGWQQYRRLGRGEVWTYTDPIDPTNRYEALVTLDKNVGDYGARIADLIETLSVVEDRSMWAVLTDMTTTGWDTRSIRLYPRTPSGTIPLHEAARAHEAAKELVQAAAVAAASPRPMAIQPAQKPSVARDLVRSSRVGPSGAGSYILTVRTPIVSGNGETRDQLDPASGEDVRPVESGEPFGRRVSRLLYSAVSNAHEACILAQARSGSIDVFSQYVNRGISSNLLDALAGFSGEDTEGRFEIRFSWGLDSPLEQETPPIAFSAGTGATLSDGAKALRNQVQSADIQMRGVVVKLHREAKHGPGDITLAGYILGSEPVSFHRVRARLEHEQYSSAASAHEQGREIIIGGSLLARGVRLQLSPVTKLQVLHA